MENPIRQCLTKASQLNLHNHPDGFIATCTDWGEGIPPSFDFYLIVEADSVEGRFSAVPCANFSNERWNERSGEPLDFWVCRIGKNAAQLSYFHPSDRVGIDWEPQPIWGFNISAAMVVASADNRKRREKILFKKLEPQRKRLLNEQQQVVQGAIRAIVRELNFTPTGAKLKA